MPRGGLSQAECLKSGALQLLLLLCCYYNELSDVDVNLYDTVLSTTIRSYLTCDQKRSFGLTVGLCHCGFLLYS